jgi:hypothetical protein
MEIIMGKTYRDIVSGFEGICTGVVEWMYGCQQYTLQPRSDVASRKEKSSLFFARQLELVDDGISDKVEAPTYDAPAFFGKECVDKVTGVHGMCIGRGIGLFSSPQYILEIQPEDHEKPSRYEWLDEGRMAVAENPSREVDPETVKGEKPGSGFLPDFLPEFDFI